MKLTMGDPLQGTLTTTADRCANAFGRQLQRLVGRRGLVRHEFYG